MKPFFAYALLVIGIPMFFGLFIGGILTIPIIRFLDNTAGISPLNPNLLYLDIIHGFVASLTAAFLFRLFGVKPGFAVPTIMAAWITFYFFGYRQSKRGWGELDFGTFYWLVHVW